MPDLNIVRCLLEFTCLLLYFFSVMLRGMIRLEVLETYCKSEGTKQTPDKQCCVGKKGSK